MKPTTEETVRNGEESPPLFSRFPLLEYKFARFLLVGGSAALAYVAISTALVSIFPGRGRLIAVAVYLACIPIAFLGQRKVTFQSKGPRIWEFLKYAGLQAFAVTSSTFLVGRLITNDPTWNAAVFLCISGLATLISFAVCQFLVFRPR
jgi:putative flippase GtrA